MKHTIQSLRRILYIAATLIALTGNRGEARTAPVSAAERATLTGILLHEREENYAASLTSLLHWARFPVRVAFTDRSHDADPALLSLALKGFDQWVQVSGGAVKYQVVSDPKRADITVALEPVGYRPLSGDRLGTTGFTYSRVRRVLSHADMRLRIWDHMTREDMAGFENTAAHEFGHALGLNGHSPDPHDLMYFTSSQTEGVTARDWNTLRQAYGDFARPADEPNATQAPRKRGKRS